MKEKRKKKKRYKVELTAASMCLWGGLFLFLIVWAFILGILVGEGLLPEAEFKIKKKKNIIQEPKKEAEPEFSFHKRLTSPKAEEKRHKNASKRNICYSVQVAAFLKEKDALNMIRRLRKKKYHAYYTKTTKDNRIYYRVRCGRFNSKQKAEVLRKRILREEHIKGIIVKCK